MLKKFLKIVISIFLITICGCGSSHDITIKKEADLKELVKGMPQILSKDDSISVEIKKPESVERIKESYKDGFGLDLRYTDLTDFDVENIDLSYASFDTKTKWQKNISDYYDVKKSLDYGKNPGLGIQALHKKGITGKGVNVAIIDTVLLADHQEYKDNLMLYEKKFTSETTTGIHGPAVTSIIAGDSVGIAPDVNIFYIATSIADEDEKSESNSANLIQCIDRVIEINKALPSDNKIKVLSISKGYTKFENQEIYEAIERAKKEGIFVITCSLNENYNYYLNGLDRRYDANPDEVDSYQLFDYIYANKEFKEKLINSDTIFVPVANRTLAGPLSTKDYAHYGYGGDGWTVPWLTGIYALCLQVNPELSGEDFLKYIFATGDDIDLTDLYEEGDYYTYPNSFRSVIVNPEKLIDKIEKL